jgi:capsular exopolysaccharide synthesis family protein
MYSGPGEGLDGKADMTTTNASGNVPGRLATGGAGPAPAAGAVPPPTVDPFKILNKYKWVLLASALLGAFLGVGAHFALARFMPVYRPTVVFQCFLGQNNIRDSMQNDIVPKDDMERFMQTRVRIMSSPIVLRAVVEDRRLQSLAPTWTRRFIEGGSVNTRDALIRIQKDVSARMIPETRLIELGFSYREPREATAMVGLVKEAFLNFMQAMGREQFRAQLDALQAELTDITDEVERRTNERQQIITKQKLDSIDQRATETRDQLSLYNKELVDIRLNSRSASKKLEGYMAELRNPSGVPRYPDMMRSQVEKDPELGEMKRTISAIEADIAAMEEGGYTKDHRDYKRAEAALAGHNRKIEEMRERLLREQFNAEIDGMRTVLDQLAAQESDTLKRTEEFQAKLVDLTKFQAQIADIERITQTLTLTGAEYRSSINNLRALEKVAQGQGVSVIAAERIPDEMAFPKLTIVAPVVMLLFVSLIGGLVVLREIMDQRVKGPGDVAMIPRTRVLGLVPDASEDPTTGEGAVETAFRDKGKGAIAESFRQIRSTLTKRLQQAGHRTVVVMAGMPGSGATTTACNLAMASAGAGRKVLLIDANLRRPALHRVFGLQEGAGLVDLLSQGGTLESALQKTADGKLDVLTVGSRDKRMFELLSTEAMSQLLAEARGIYDLVLLDTAPAIVAGDGLALANKCDASVLVVKAYSEKRGMVARIRNELLEARAEFVGVVVNGVRAAAGGYLRRNIRAAADYHQAA